MSDRQPLDTEREGSQGGVMLHAEHLVDPAPPVTWEAFIALPEDDTRELIDGVLVEVEVATSLHEWLVSELMFALMLWAREHGGVVLGSGYKVRINRSRTAGRAFMPDVQVYRDREVIGRPEFEQGLSEGAPDLVVEVISPSSGRHDRVTKFNGYASIGCPEYWLVDPESRLFEQFVLDGEHYRLAARLSDDAVFSPETFAGLSIPLGPMWSLAVEPEPKAE